MDEWTGELDYDIFHQLQAIFKEAISSWFLNAFNIKLG